MNFQKPKKDDITSQLTLGGGAVGGALASNYLATLIAGDLKLDGDAQKAKEQQESYNTKKKLIKGGFVLASLATALCVKGNDALANLVRGVSYGVTVSQGVSLISEFVDTNKAENKEIKKAIEGLKGGCTSCLNGGLEWLDRYSIMPSHTYTVLNQNNTDYNPQKQVSQEENSRIASLMSYSDKLES